MYNQLICTIIFVFLFYYFECLCSGNRSLQVVAVQVTLQVEVGQHLAIVYTQQSLQLCIGHNGVLVLQLVLLHVGGDLLGHIGPALLGAIGYTQEATQIVRQSGGQLEDRGLAGLYLLTLNGLLGATAALVSLLLQAGYTLLQALQLCYQGANSLANSVCLGQHCLYIILHGQSRSLGCLYRGGSHSGGSYHGCNGCSYHGGRSYCRGRGLLGGSLLGLRCSRGCRGRCSGCGNLLGLLSHSLSSLGSRGRRTHYTSSRGSIHGGNTHLRPAWHSIFGQGF